MYLDFAKKKIKEKKYMYLIGPYIFFLTFNAFLLTCACFMMLIS